MLNLARGEGRQGLYEQNDRTISKSPVGPVLIILQPLCSALVELLSYVVHWTSEQSAQVQHRLRTSRRDGQVVSQDQEPGMCGDKLKCWSTMLDRYIESWSRVVFAGPMETRDMMLRANLRM